jgi:hypothetical protein
VLEDALDNPEYFFIEVTMLQLQNEMDIQVEQMLSTCTDENEQTKIQNCRQKNLETLTKFKAFVIGQIDSFKSKWVPLAREELLSKYECVCFYQNCQKCKEWFNYIYQCALEKLFMTKKIFYVSRDSPDFDETIGEYGHFCRVSNVHLFFKMKQLRTYKTNEEIITRFPEFFIKVKFSRIKLAIAELVNHQSQNSIDDAKIMFAELDFREKEMLDEKEEALEKFTEKYSPANFDSQIIITKVRADLKEITGHVYFSHRKYDWGNKVCTTSLGVIHKDDFQKYQVISAFDACYFEE